MLQVRRAGPLPPFRHTLQANLLVTIGLTTDASGRFVLPITTRTIHSCSSGPRGAAGAGDDRGGVSLFLPVVDRWFAQTLGAPTRPQREGWPLIRSGRHVLITAPRAGGTLAGVRRTQVAGARATGAVPERKRNEPRRTRAEGVFIGWREGVAALRSIDAARRSQAAHGGNLRGIHTASRRWSAPVPPPRSLVTIDARRGYR